MSFCLQVNERNYMDFDKPSSNYFAHTCCAHIRATSLTLILMKAHSTQTVCGGLVFCFIRQSHRSQLIYSMNVPTESLNILYKYNINSIYLMLIQYEHESI